MDNVTDEQWSQVDGLFGDGLPEYFTKVSKNSISVKVSDWSGSKTIKVTPAEIVRYFHSDARNISSGIRTLGGWSGDWRPVDELAQEILAVYKIINRPALEREAKKYGMELK